MAAAEEPGMDVDVGRGNHQDGRQTRGHHHHSTRGRLSLWPQRTQGLLSWQGRPVAVGEYPVTASMPSGYDPHRNRPRSPLTKDPSR